jgi:hypothetical protein
MCHYEKKTQKLHCKDDNNYNDDNMMGASVWYMNSLVVYFNVKTHDLGKELDNK